jgi:hypothetical protein
LAAKKKEVPAVVAPIKDNPAEKKVIDIVVARYRFMNGGNPCAFGVFSNDGNRHTEHPTAPCHAQLQYWGAKIGSSYYGQGACEFDQLITSYWAVEPLEFRYFDFLKNRLFKNWSDLITLEASEHHIDFDKKKDGAVHVPPHVAGLDKEKYQDQPWYFIRVSDLSKIPANVLYNFCIATRVTVEYREFLKTWGRLCEAGVDPGVAFLLANTGTVWPVKAADIMNTKTSANYGARGHWAYDNDPDLERFVRGNPDSTKFGKMYKEKTGDCRPANVIWGNLGRASQAQYLGKTPKEIMQSFGLIPAEPTPPDAKDNPNRMEAVKEIPMEDDDDDLLDEDFDDDDNFDDFDDDERDEDDDDF